MDSIKKAMLAMKNEMDASKDKADQLEDELNDKKLEKEKVAVDCVNSLSDIGCLVKNELTSTYIHYLLPLYVMDLV